MTAKADTNPLREALPEFEDPRVQIVYELLCNPYLNTPPNPEEHWEGWVSRNIVAALASEPVAGTETRQQKNEREMAEGHRCDGSCNDGMPCHCESAPPAPAGREEIARTIAHQLGENYDRLVDLHLNAGFCQDDFLRAADAALALSPQGGCAWQPIETAPRDGTPFLCFHHCDVFSPQTGIDLIWYEPGIKTYTMDGDTEVPFAGITHWRPLPTPPTLPRAERGGDNG